MKKRLSLFFFLFLLLTAGSGAAREPLSPQEVSEVLHAHPEIISSLISENPKLFLDAFRLAAFNEKQQEEQERKKAEKEQQEEELKHPKKADVKGRFLFGELNAPLTVVEYSDFQCPYCKKVHHTMQELLKKYPGKIRFVHKHLPLSFHPQSRIAAEYFEAVFEQSREKARRFTAVLFSHPGELSGRGEAFLAEEAEKLNVNMKKLKKALVSERIKKRIDADIAEAHSFGFEGTPAFLVNGVSVYGSRSVSFFSELFDRLLALEKSRT